MIGACTSPKTTRRILFRELMKQTGRVALVSSEGGEEIVEEKEEDESVVEFVSVGETCSSVKLCSNELG
jgi:hypothetical protein